MTGILDHLRRLSAAEEFFSVLEVPFEQARLDVNRLHILKRFNEYMRSEGVAALADEPACVERCRACLTRAYADFLTSDAQTEKVFKVFKQQQGFVPLDSLLPPR
ncbi:MAG: nitrogenase-stabilizing/protective protein NifW [Magnetospirillum sp.]|nr:nitrogenase-stabilizing/protective protein NifW [Magnetospirillum sp.]